MGDFPFWQMAVVCVMRFSEPLAFTSLFPYLYFMIRDFQIAKTEADISKYSGYMASSFAFCQFLFAIHWGKTSDKIGRKPVLIFGLMGTSACLLAFGFSKNYYMAFAARAIAGMLNGNVSVLRTTIGEICHEKRHQALGYSTLPFLFNLGSVIGPLIGGCALFTQPSSRNPYEDRNSTLSGTDTVQSSHFILAATNLQPTDILGQFRAKFPYALSNIVVTLVIWTSCIIGFLFLEETNDKFKNRRDVGLEMGDCILRLVGVDMPPRVWNQKNLDEETPLIDHPKLSDSLDAYNSPDTSEEDVESVGPFSKTVATSLVRRYSQSSALTLKKEVRVTPRVISVIISNCIFALHNISFIEFLPVFLAAPIHAEELLFPFKIVGGFGLETSTIGTLFSSTGIVGMVIIFSIFPWIDRNFGTLQGFRLSLLFFPIVYFLIPLSIFTLNSYNAHNPEWLTIGCLYFLTSLKTLAVSTGLPQVMILTHRAASKPHRAYVNSIMMSMVALSRCLGPIIFGYVMTLGDTHKVAWLSWWIMAAMAFFGFCQTFFMTDADE